MVHRVKKIFFFFLVFIACTIEAQEVLDKIVAVVDKDIILKSELDFRVNIEAAQKNLNPNDTTLRKQVLNQLIEEKLLYAQAELDSINVTDDQVKQQLDYQMNYFIQQYGSRERLEQAYGMSIEKLKRSLEDDVRKNLMAQMLQQKKFGDVTVSRKEVEDFYDTFKDSLGLIPERFTIAHIFINPKSGERVRNKAKNFAESLLDSLKHGADFAELAKKYSDDPGSASQGGDLGFVKRGVFYPEFEAVAFSLAPKQTSDVIESPVGFHIIQLLERRGDEIHVRHILIKIKSDEKADLAAIDLLNDIRDSVLSGKNSFAYYAKKYSDDKETAKNGGLLGTFEENQLDKSLLDIVYKLKDGEISFPKRLDVNKSTYGYHIVQLIKRTPQHKANLDTDYDELKRLAEYYKKQKLYKEWMAELKDKIYWEIKA
ncbi:peptidylprolyl isomerase [Melioribacteraceae bacterium 4301-Me]|uniref:peptidylprolyl isomerase n=1 Tax=Pyranulibacter aquaticus TaxID=3163344 RepID=UPI0035969C4B